MKKININGIEVEVIKKKIKNIRLTVYPGTGIVKLSVPMETSDEFITKFIEAKFSWIEKHVHKMKKTKNQKDRLYVSGEVIFLWGKKYNLKVLIHKNKKVEISGDNIVLYVQKDCTFEKRRDIIKEWYREEIKKEVSILLEKWQSIMKVSANSFGIKDMKTRWGTCNVRDKRIWLNLRLARRPYRCLEYVVVHELTHLIERNHNDMFKEYMDRFLPDWRIIKAELNKFNVEYFEE